MLEQAVASIQSFISNINLERKLLLLCLPALGVGCGLYSWLLHPLLCGRLRHVPGPWQSNCSSLFLAFHEIAYRRNDKIAQWHKQYGPVVRIAPNEVSVASLQDTREVYGSRHRWPKSGYFDNFMEYGARSVFATRSYEAHQAKRRLTSSFYQASNIYRFPELERHIQERSLAALHHVQQNLGQETDVYSLADWYALDNITFLVLGPEHCTRCINQDCYERRLLQDLKYQQFAGPLRIRFPQTLKYASRFLAKCSRRQFGFLVADNELASWCQSRFHNAIDDPRLTRTHSLLRHLCDSEAATDESGPGLDKKTIDLQYIAAEVLDNINAAEATVAVTATYLVWRLTESPHWQRRIRGELSRLPVQKDGALAFAHIDHHVPSLEACLREVYRLHPASSGRAERVVPPGGRVMSGFYLPENTIVTASVKALHHDENVYPDSNLFAPERWLEIDEQAWKLRDAQLIPFGHGARICLGKALATMEIKLFVAALYRKYETIKTSSLSAESMRQCSTHDAVPEGLKCMVRFQLVEHPSDSISASV